MAEEPAGGGGPTYPPGTVILPGGQVVPPSGSGAAPPPPTPAFCFEWGGQRWGKDYPGWSEFRAWLERHGDDPDVWITQHPAAASCIGAKKLAYCFEWDGKKWGKDYPGWSAFRAWLVSHGADVNLLAQEHVAAAHCIGAPASVFAPSGPGAEPAPKPTPKPTPKPGPSPTPTPAQPPPTSPPAGAAPFGTTADAGPFAGTGIMVGSNPGAIEALLAPGFRQAHGITWVAVEAGTDPQLVDQLRGAGYTIVVWQPPETAAGSDPQAVVDEYGAVGYIGQAESQDQWNVAAANVGKVNVPTAIITNLWQPGGYGRFPLGTVAMPETYVNAGDQANYNNLSLFTDAGAAAVVPLAGIWNDNNNAPATYSALANRGLPGVAGFVGDDQPASGGLAAITGVGGSLGAVSGTAPTPTAGAGAGVTPAGNVDAAGARYCFAWGGELWGGDHPGWPEFSAWLSDHGDSPAQWILNHPAAAVCIGAPQAEAAVGAPPTSGAAGGQPLGQQIRFSHVDLEQLWMMAGGPREVADIAAAIAQAESGGCRYAHAGPTDDRPVKTCLYTPTNGENSYGLWQINLRAHPVYSAAAMYEPGANAEAAVQVYRARGNTFNAWSTYTVPPYPYRQYLTGAQPPPETGVPPSPIPPTVTPGTTPGAVPAKPTTPPGLNAAWRAFLNRFSRYAPSQRRAAVAIFSNPRELFR